MKCLSLIIVVAAVSLHAEGSRSQDAALRSYVLGVELLASRQGLSEAQKAAYYRRLVQLTNVTAGEAIDYINSYRERPGAWKKLREKIVRIVEQYSFPQPDNETVPTESIAVRQAPIPHATDRRGEYSGAARRSSIP